MAATQNLEWASYLVTRRTAIDRLLAGRRSGATSPGPSASEALRRFRSFAASTLRRGEGAEPALDGLRVDPEATSQWIEHWCDAAADSAGARAPELRKVLAPLQKRFTQSLRGAQLARSAKRAKPAARRAVIGAIDRIADAFLAIDIDSGEIADANPAAATLLGKERPELVGRRALRFIDRESHELWNERLENVGESGEGQRFRVIWRDEFMSPVAVDIWASAHLTRRRRLAIITARPVDRPTAP